MVEMKALKARTLQGHRLAMEDLHKLVLKRREMENDVSYLLETGFTSMAIDFFDNDALEVPVNGDGLSSAIMDACYYPIVDAFDEHCYSVACNDYFTGVLGPFADYCEKGFDAKYVLQVIPYVCNQPKCGVN